MTCRDFDRVHGAAVRDHRAAMNRMARHRRLMSRGIGVVLACFTAAALVAVYLIVTTPPGDVGAWLGRIVAGFRGAA